jgi:DNA-binding SARP family transcriptional activator/predicted ATPase
MSAISLTLFGPPHVLRDGRPATTDTRKALALLAYLAATRDYHSRETLAALLWPEMDDERARAALRRTLSAARSLLNPDVLAATRETVALLPGPGLSVDIWAFDDALAAAEHHHRAGDALCVECLAGLATAVDLYRDDFLQGFTLRDSLEFDDWQVAQAERWRRALAAALAHLVTGHVTQGDLDAAVGYARRWLELDPLREDAHRWLMQLYSWTGARDLALRQYRDAVRVLDTELGVEPLPETTALYEAIQENRLPAPSGVAPAAGPPAADHPGPARHPVTPLIGRAAAWSRLTEAYGRVGATGQVVLISGETGIGKTRLAEAFLDHSQSLGATGILAAWHEGEANLAYAPFAAALRTLVAQPALRPRLAGLPPLWLAEASRLAPELEAWAGAPPPPESGGLGAQTRFFAAVSEVLCSLLAGPSPGVLALDDAQWADEASLDLLAYLARRLAELPLFLMVTWTEDAAPGDHRLRRVMTEARRAGNGHTVRLDRWQPGDVSALLATADMSTAALPADTAERLYRETEGLPYFVVEYLRAMADDPAGAWAVPQTVRDLLTGRLAGIDETGRQLLQTAAVIGRSFDYASLWAASGRSEDEVVGGLERLLGRGLVRETPGSDPQRLVYDFTHPQLRSVVYDDIHLARRRLLHRRVADALAGAGRGAPAAEQHSQIGYHYQMAGQEERAAEAFRQAGEYARSVYAHREALTHFETALALGHPDGVALQEASGDLHTLLGEYNAALHAYESAAAQAKGDALAQLEHKLGQVYERRGDWELAGSHLRAADALAGDQPALRARIAVDRSRVAHRSGDAAAAAELAAQGLTLAEEGHDRLAEALAHNTLGILDRQAGRHEAARAHFAESLALAEAEGAATARVASLNNLARLHAASGDVAGALVLLDQALELGRQQGDRHHEAALLNHRADVLHQAGREAEAMASLKEAVAIYAEIGLEAGTWQPEIWKLTEW